MSIKPYAKFTDATGTRVYAEFKGADVYIDFDNNSNSNVIDSTFKVGSKSANLLAKKALSFLDK